MIGRFAWQYSIVIGIWMGSLAFPSPFRYVLWGVAVAWELSIPWLARRLYVAIPLSASHVPERFALFTLIVLGETIVVAPWERPAQSGRSRRSWSRRSGSWSPWPSGGLSLEVAARSR